MSLYRIATRLSRSFYSTCPSYTLVHSDWRHNQQYLIVSPSNHLRKFIHSQTESFKFSLRASSKHPKNTYAAKSNENAEESDSEQEEDLWKLVSEKEELLIVKQKEIENMKDKILRTLAEAENVKDRTRREADNMKKFAIQNFAKGLLDVADNLSRASSVVKESFSKIDGSNTNDSSDSGATTLLKTLLEGVEMTEKQLAEVFRKSGVEKFDPISEQFDPNRHNAVFQVPDASKPPGTVAIVLKVGYMLHDRVLRAAEVGVTIADGKGAE